MAYTHSQIFVRLPVLLVPFQAIANWNYFSPQIPPPCQETLHSDKVMFFLSFSLLESHAPVWITLSDFPCGYTEGLGHSRAILTATQTFPIEKLTEKWSHPLFHFLSFEVEVGQYFLFLRRERDGFLGDSDGDIRILQSVTGDRQNDEIFLFEESHLI